MARSLLPSSQKGIFTLALLVCFPLFYLSQQDTIKADRTQVTDFYFAAGRANFPVFNMSPEKFKEVVPKSQLLSGDLMTVDYNNYYSDTAGGFENTVKNLSSYVQAGLTLRLRNREFKNAGPWLKLGLSYFSSSTILSSGIFRSKESRQDSLYFVTGTPVNRVTQERRELTYIYSCQSINFEGTLIYKLNPEGIFSLFGGPGVFLGMNYGGKAELEGATINTVSDYKANSFGHDGELISRTSTVSNAKTEVFDKGPNLSAGLFVNVGVDLRLGNRFEVIKNIHAFVEAKPMFRMYGVKGAGMQNSILLVGNLGLRYEI